MPGGAARSFAGRVRHRWRALGIVILLIGVTATSAGYLLVVHEIRLQLDALVRDNLDARLQHASISWRPPYGIIVRNARIVRGDGRGGQLELFHVDRLDLGLAGIPRDGGPIVIRTLLASGPSIHLLTTEQQAGPSRTPVVPNPPSVPVSAQIQVGRVEINGGSLFYQDRTNPGAPELAVKNISLQAEAPASPGGIQHFELSARDGSTDLHADGSVQPDQLIIGINDISVDVRLDPTASQSALPQPLSDCAKRFGVGGQFALHGKGRLPIQSPQLSSFDGTLELSNASAALPGEPWRMQQAHLKLLCDSEPAAATQPATVPATAAAPAALPALHIRLAACDADFGGVGLHLDSADFREDPVASTWKLTQLAGRVAGVALATPASMPAPPEASPAEQPPLRGRIDFTATASGPIPGPGEASTTGKLKYEVLAFPRDLALKIKSFPRAIEHIDDGQIRIDGGAVSLRDMAGDYGGDRIILRTARIPLPQDISQLWKLETRIEEITGTVTCNQPAPEYPQGIQSIIEDLRPGGTFTIGNGRLTLNYREPQSGKPKPQDDFAFDVSSDGAGSFAVTNRRIAITQVRGNATLDNLGIMIGTDGIKNNVIQGKSLGGDVALHMNIRPASDSEPALFLGEVWARNIDVSTLCNVFDLRAGQISRAGGKGFVHGTFSVEGSGGKRPPAQTLRAAGEAEVLGADYWEDPVVRLVAGDMEARSTAGAAIKKQPGVCDAAAVFHIADGVVTVDQAAVNSPSLGIQGTGTINFRNELDVQVVAAPIGDLQSAIKRSAPSALGKVAADIVGVVQGALRSATGSLLYEYHITGPVNHLKKQIVPVPVLSDAGALLFGRMAEQKHGELLKNVQAGAFARQAEAPQKPAPAKAKEK